MSETDGHPRSAATSAAATKPPTPEISCANAGPVGGVPAEMPMQFGRYRILEFIGQGRMGDVYRAEQREPVRRIVAVKIIKAGLDSAQVVHRFEAERQALALMDHPNVARIFDGGISDQGRPYFVMEFVPGTILTRYCDENRLSIAQRLELMIQICHAVQHAHQKGIIHRDLKPSNILVIANDGKATAKVIDFGLAKAVHQPLTEHTLCTEIGQLVGTPEYMSPEQAAGSVDIDTRTDVYSLGVILYELLTGALPLDSAELRGAGAEHMLRMIRESEPARPSTRFARRHRDEGGGQAALVDRARRRHRSDPRSLRRELRGDLDWITLKAMEKDRSRRYETAHALAVDLERHLRDEVVSARPYGVVYRARKFVRRHTVGVAAAALVMLSLLAGIAGTTVALVKARTERAMSQAMESFMEDLLRSASPRDPRGGRDVKVIDILEKADPKLAEQFRGKPALEARARRALGNTYSSLGVFDRAREQLEKARELSRNALGDDDEQTLDIAALLSWAMMESAHPQDAEHLRDAEKLASDTLDRARKALGDEHKATHSAANAKVAMLFVENRHAEGEQLIREMLPHAERAQLLNFCASYQHNLGMCYRAQGRLKQAEDCLRAAMDYEQKLAPARLYGYRTKEVFAQILAARGKLAEAQQYYSDILVKMREQLSDSHPDTMRVMGDYALLLVRAGKPEDAVRWRQILLTTIKDPAESDGKADRLAQLADLHCVLGEYDKAMLHFEDAVAMRRALHTDDDWVAQAWWRTVHIRRALGPERGWKCPTLRQRLEDMLDEALVKRKESPYGADQLIWTTAQARLQRWAGAELAERAADADQAIQGPLAALTDVTPEAGLHRLTAYVPWPGSEPLRAQAWVLCAPWEVSLYAMDSAPDQIGANWPSMIRGKPLEMRSSPLLWFANGWGRGFGPRGCLEYFGIVAAARVALPPGSYTFRIRSDDGVRLWIDDSKTPAIDDWSGHAAKDSEATVELAGGAHTLRIEYYQERFDATLQVWAEPTEAEKPTRNAQP